jgi:hypothetical protein
VLGDVRVPGFEVLQELLLEPLRVVDRDVVEVAVGDRVDRDDLLFHGKWLVLELLEDLDDARAAVELRL